MFGTQLGINENLLIFHGATQINLTSVWIGRKDGQKFKVGKLSRRLWMQYKQYIVNSVYEKYAIKPYLILLYLVHLLKPQTHLNPHISCYVPWTSCVLSGFLKEKRRFTKLT